MTADTPRGLLCVMAALSASSQKWPLGRPWEDLTGSGFLLELVPTQLAATAGRFNRAFPNRNRPIFRPL